MKPPHSIGPDEDHGHAPLSGVLSRLPGPLKVIAGFVLLCVGAILVLPGVPGPGILVILLGLLLLSERFLWARRLLAWSRAKFARIMGRESRKSGDDANGRPRAPPGA